VLYIFISVLDPSSPRSSLQVTYAQNGLLFILAEQRNCRSSAVGHVSYRHSANRQPVNLGWCWLSVYMNQQYWTQPSVCVL